MKKLLKTLSLSLWASGCAAGGLVAAPYRARESELGPAAAEGRAAVVIERAGAFEKQNAKSRDVYWYRIWRASGMIGMGQIAEGEAVLDQTLIEIGAPEVTVAEPQRLRMFAYDEKAKAAIVRGSWPEAVSHLERALQLAIEIEPSTGGKCDRELALAARQRQLVDLAARAGDATKSERAAADSRRRLEEWSLCLGRRDFPAMQSLVAIKGLLGGNGAPEAVAAAPAPAPAPAPSAPPKPAAVPKPTAAPAPAPAPPPAPSAPTAGLRALNIRYAPIDPSPYKEPIDKVLAVVDRNYKGAQGDALIRVDGGRRALRLRVPTKRFEGVAALVPLFKNMVIFFENMRNIEPKIEEVVVQIEAPDGNLQIVAQRGDIFDLFVDKIDVAGFSERLVEVR